MKTIYTIRKENKIKKKTRKNNIDIRMKQMQN